MKLKDMNVEDAISWVRCDFDKIDLPMARICLKLLTDEVEGLREKPLSYVQVIPDHCDRIIWRNNYYNLPLSENK
jgi:hypothetical protein